MDIGFTVIGPLIFFGSIVLIFTVSFYFHHRNRRVIYDAIKASVEKTGEADPKLIAAITHDAIGPNADLRRGVLFLCVSLTLGLVSFGGGSDMMGFPLWGAAFFTGLIGAAYATFHFFMPRELMV